MRWSDPRPDERGPARGPSLRRLRELNQQRIERERTQLTLDDDDQEDDDE